MTVSETHEGTHATREVDPMIELVAIAVLAIVLGFQGGVALKAFAGNVYVTNAIAADRVRDDLTAAWSLEQALDWNPADYQAQYWLGALRRDAGETQEAAEAFSRCLRLAPNHVAAMLALAELNAESGDGEAALRLIRRAEAIVPADWRVHMSSGFIAGISGDHEGAMREFERALANGGGQSPVLVDRVVVASLALEQYSRALRYAERAVTLEPDEPAHAVLYGKALLAADRPGRAAESISRALTLMDGQVATNAESHTRDSIEARLLLCDARFGQGDYAGGAETYLECVQMFPTSEAVLNVASDIWNRVDGVDVESFSSGRERGMALYRLGLAFRFAGEFDLSESALSGALAADLHERDRTDCAIALADILARTRRFEDALALLDKARRRAPATLSLDVAYAEALVMNRRGAEALLVYLDIAQKYELDSEMRARVNGAIDSLRQ